MILGFNSGKIDKISYLEKLKIFQKIECNALEIGGLRLERLPIFWETLDKVDYKKFDYVSFHAPVKNGEEWLTYQDDKQTRKILGEIVELQKAIKFSLVVLHPDRVKDWSVLEDYDLPFAIENMDNRKDSCQTAEDFKKIFEVFDGKLVVDVNHCFTNDPTMKLARDFFEKFDDEIAEVHLAGYAGLHDPLFQTKQNFIMDPLIGKKVPIIIESMCKSKEEYENEYNYVKNYIYSQR